jgi:hypothetical protein
MPSIAKLKTPILQDQLESYLRFDFPQKKVKRNLFGNISLKDDAEMNVIFKVKENEIQFYATSRFLASLFS